MLAPEKHKKFLSWLTGWLTFAGWTGNASATTIFVGQMLLAALQVSNSSYRPDDATLRWQATLIALLTLLLIFIINTVLNPYLPALGRGLLVYQFCAIVAIFVPMGVMSAHVDAREVFATFYNQSGWSSNGVAFMIGLSSSNIALIGLDVPMHFGRSPPVFHPALTR